MRDPGMGAVCGKAWETSGSRLAETKRKVAE